MANPRLPSNKLSEHETQSGGTITELRNLRHNLKALSAATKNIISESKEDFANIIELISTLTVILNDFTDESAEKNDKFTSLSKELQAISKQISDLSAKDDLGTDSLGPINSILKSTLAILHRLPLHEIRKFSAKIPATPNELMEYLFQNVKEKLSFFTTSFETSTQYIDVAMLSTSDENIASFKTKSPMQQQVLLISLLKVLQLMKSIIVYLDKFEIENNLKPASLSSLALKLPFSEEEKSIKTWCETISNAYVKRLEACNYSLQTEVYPFNIAVNQSRKELKKLLETESPENITAFAFKKAKNLSIAFLDSEIRKLPTNIISSDTSEESVDGSDDIARMPEKKSKSVLTGLLRKITPSKINLENKLAYRAYVLNELKNIFEAKVDENRNDIRKFIHDAIAEIMSRDHLGKHKLKDEFIENITSTVTMKYHHACGNAEQKIKNIKDKLSVIDRRMAIHPVSTEEEAALVASEKKLTDINAQCTKITFDLLQSTIADIKSFFSASEYCVTLSDIEAAIIKFDQYCKAALKTEIYEKYFANEYLDATPDDEIFIKNIAQALHDSMKLIASLKEYAKTEPHQTPQEDLTTTLQMVNNVKIQAKALAINILILKKLPIVPEMKSEIQDILTGLNKFSDHIKTKYTNPNQAIPSDLNGILDEIRRIHGQVEIEKGQHPDTKNKIKMAFALAKSFVQKPDPNESTLYFALRNLNEIISTVAYINLLKDDFTVTAVKQLGPDLVKLNALVIQAEKIISHVEKTLHLKNEYFAKQKQVLLSFHNTVKAAGYDLTGNISNFHKPPLDMIDERVVELKRQRDNYFFLFSKNKRTLIESSIQAWEALQQSYQKPGYTIADAAAEVHVIHHLSKEFFRTKSEAVWFARVTNEDAKISPIDRGLKIIAEDTKPTSAPATKENMIVSINTFLETTNTNKKKISLLNELKSKLQSTNLSLQESLKTLQKDSLYSSSFYLLHEGRTGKLLKELEISQLSKEKMINRIDVEIARLKRLDSTFLRRHCILPTHNKMMAQLTQLKANIGNDNFLSSPEFLQLRSNEPALLEELQLWKKTHP